MNADKRNPKMIIFITISLIILIVSFVPFIECPAPLHHTNSPYADSCSVCGGDGYVTILEYIIFVYRVHKA